MIILYHVSRDKSTNFTGFGEILLFFCKKKRRPKPPFSLRTSGRKTLLSPTCCVALEPNAVVRNICPARVLRYLALEEPSGEDARETRLAPTRARRQRRKSRRLDQDPETAFLSSRGLYCCEGFEPQPPKRLKMRRFILGCRFTRADACVREAIEPLIKTSTFRLPVEAKIIPSPRPKPPQRFFSAEGLFVPHFALPRRCPRRTII